MNWRATGRISIALLLIGGVFSLGVHYQLQEDDHYPYPDTTDLKTSPEEHIDTQVFVFGTVEAMSEERNTATIRIDTDEGPFTADINRFSTQKNVKLGGTVKVYGTFQQESLIEANNVRVVNPNGFSDMYKYVVSVVGAIFVMALFFRYWRFNARTLGFEMR